MAIEPQKIPIRFAGVEISTTAICEIRGDAVCKAVQRDQIRNIKLAYETDSTRPFCRYFLGFTLFSLGLIGLSVVFLASLGGAPLTRIEPGETGLPLIPIILWLMTGAGLWLLIGIFRASYNLSVETENGTRRIFFEKPADVGGLRQFINKANLSFGYEIDHSILENM